MRTLLLLAISLGFAAGCSKSNPYYCEGNPDDNCLIDADIDKPMGCTTSAQCTNAAKPVCETAMKLCVACTADEVGSCGGTTPVCSSTNTCTACTAHGQCDSHACTPDGSCAAETSVAYVDPSGTDNDSCSKAMPCTSVAKALATTRAYVKFNGSTDEAVTISGGRKVTFLANTGAVLTRTSGTGPIITIQDDNTSLTVYDLSISNAPNNASGRGILIPGVGTPAVTLVRTTISNNPGGGISATGGSLAIQQSTIANNAGGGVLVSGTGTMFAITNNVIVYNGTANGANATQLGGVAITSNTTGAKFEWNTIAFNQSDGSVYRGGVSCTGAMVSAAGNLIYRNSETDGGGGLVTDTTTQRNATGCDFGNTLAVATDAGNLGFKSPATQPFDFHLTASSPATIIDAGGTCSGTDFDGDARPIGNACDLGADEYRP
jgi:hypothetical protein